MVCEASIFHGCALKLGTPEIPWSWRLQGEIGPLQETSGAISLGWVRYSEVEPESAIGRCRQGDLVVGHGWKIWSRANVTLFSGLASKVFSRGTLSAGKAGICRDILRRAISEKV